MAIIHVVEKGTDTPRVFKNAVAVPNINGETLTVFDIDDDTALAQFKMDEVAKWYGERDPDAE